MTKVSLTRYKVELDQKQRYLKTTQRYEGEVRDLRACLAVIVDAIGVKEAEIPEIVRRPNQTGGQEDTIEGIRGLIADNKDLMKVVNAVDRRMLKLIKHTASHQDEAQDEIARIN